MQVPAVLYERNIVVVPIYIRYQLVTRFTRPIYQFKSGICLWRKVRPVSRPLVETSAVTSGHNKTFAVSVYSPVSIILLIYIISLNSGVILVNQSISLNPGSCLWRKVRPVSRHLEETSAVTGGHSQSTTVSSYCPGLTHSA